MSALRLSFEQAVAAVCAIGSTNTILLRGQPGIGKTAIAQALHATLPDYRLALIDCANLDLGDLAMPVVDREKMVTRFAPNARFGLERGSRQPILLYLDEFGKALTPVMNMLLPAFIEHRLGDWTFPTGSIVMGSLNLDSDGLGDRLPGHVYNRVTVIDLDNPTAEAWCKWARANGVHPVIVEFVRSTPQVMHRYDDPFEAERKNPYNYNPLIGQVKAVCTPRSLVQASHVMHAADALDEHTLLTLLAGTVGEPAARMIVALRNTYLKLVTTEAIVASPTTAPIPATTGEQYLLAMRLSFQTTGKNVDAITTYVMRWASFEARTLYAVTTASNREKLLTLQSSTMFVRLAAECGMFF